MKRRCAIYTRKSTEEGLEQAFNSLDAQREACAAYILSQATRAGSWSTSIMTMVAFPAATWTGRACSSCSPTFARARSTSSSSTRSIG